MVSVSEGKCGLSVEQSEHSLFIYYYYILESLYYNMYASVFIRKAVIVLSPS